MQRRPWARGGDIAGFEAAGLETGMDKTFWTSTVRSPNASLNIDGHLIAWSEKITYVGAQIHLCSNSGSAKDGRAGSCSLGSGDDVLRHDPYLQRCGRSKRKALREPKSHRQTSCRRRGFKSWPRRSKQKSERFETKRSKYFFQAGCWRWQRAYSRGQPTGRENGAAPFSKSSKKSWRHKIEHTGLEREEHEARVSFVVLRARLVTLSQGMPTQTQKGSTRTRPLARTCSFVTEMSEAFAEKDSMPETVLREADVLKRNASGIAQEGVPAHERGQKSIRLTDPRTSTTSKFHDSGCAHPSRVLFHRRVTGHDGRADRGESVWHHQRARFEKTCGMTGRQTR